MRPKKKLPEPIEPTSVPVIIPCEQQVSDGRDIWHQAAAQYVRRVRPAEFDKESPTWAAIPDSERKIMNGCAQLKTVLFAKDLTAVERVEEIQQAYRRLAREVIGVVVASPEKTKELVLSAQEIGLPPSVDYSGNEQAEEMLRQCIRLQTANKTHHRIIARILSEKAADARLVLWNSEDRMVPALYCRDIVQAAYVHLMTGMLGNGLLLCPRCDQIFLQKRPDQQFCSLQCREAHRAARRYAARRDEILAARKTRRAGSMTPTDTLSPSSRNKRKLRKPRTKEK